MPIGRVPSWCSRENNALTVTSGVMFQLRLAPPAFLLSCCTRGNTPETPGTSVPATALAIVLAFRATPAVPAVLTVHAPDDVVLPHNVVYSLFCNAGLIFPTPEPPLLNSVRVVPLKMCGVSSKRNWIL